jgi:hypothetical protein
MNRQLSQDYDVDSRYTGGKRAADNTAGKSFVMKFLKERQASKNLPYGPDLATEDRFIVAGPGESNYTFRNAFRAT